MFCLCVKKSNKKRQFHKRKSRSPSFQTLRIALNKHIRGGVYKIYSNPRPSPHVNMHVCSACAGHTQPGGPKRAMRGAVVLHNRQMVSPPPPPRTYHHQSRCTIPTAHTVRVRISGAFRVETTSFAAFGVLRLHASARYPDQLFQY